MLKVSLFTLGDPGTMTGGYLYHRRVADRAAQNDARLDFVSAPDRLPWFTGPKVLRSALAANRPDVLLVDSIAAAFVGQWNQTIPLVGILHQPPGGIDHGPGRRWLQAVLDRRTWRHASKLLIASEDLAETLRRGGLPADLLRVVPPGRDPADSAVAPATELRQGRRTAMLSVGNWVPRKGLLELLDAFARLPEDASTLHLVGDGGIDPEYGARVQRRLAAPDLAGRVVVHGLVTPAEVAGFYAASDVFALASLREPYGTVYGEAMAAGLPVVGWAAGNLPHLARSGVEGLAVPPGDVDALAEALRSLTLDEPLRQKMAAAAAKRAADFPNWDETAHVLFTEVRTVLKEEGRT